MLLEFLYFIFTKRRQISSHPVFLPRSWEVLLGPSVRPVAAAAPSLPQVPLPGNQVSCDAQPSKPRYRLILYTHVCYVKFQTFISASSLASLKASTGHLHYQRQGHEHDPLRLDVPPPPPFLLTLRDGTCFHPPVQDPDGPDGHSRTFTSAHLPPPHQRHELGTRPLQGPRGATSRTAAPPRVSSWGLAADRSPLSQPRSPPPRLPKPLEAEASAGRPEAQRSRGRPLDTC